MDYGITPEGFVRKRLEDIRLELISQFEAEFGAIDVSAGSVFGVFIGIMAKEFADEWELLEAVYYSLYPSSADGTSLDNVGDLTGIQRLAATQTIGVVQAYGDLGTPLTIGNVISIINTGDRFTVSNNEVISNVDTVNILIDVDTVTDSIDYTVTINGTPSTFNSGVSATAESIAAGLVVQILISPESIDASDNLDGTFFVTSPDFTVEFTATLTAELAFLKAAANVPVIAEQFGVIQGLAGTATVIETPVAGWDSSNNDLDFIVGRDVETDTEFRIRRAQSLQVTGAGTLESIRSRLLQVVGVTAAFVEENATDIIDGEGRPPHSFESVVAGGDDQDIADLLWLTKPAGIQTTGTESVSVVDSQGATHFMEFSRATEIFLHVRITLTLTPEENYPVDGDDQVAANVLAYGQTLTIGDDVFVQRFYAPVYEVSGIATALIEIATSATAGGAAGAWQTTNLPISNTEVAVFDSGRITVINP